MKLNIGQMMVRVEKEAKNHTRYLQLLYDEHARILQKRSKLLGISDISVIGSLAHNTHLPGSDLDINCYVPMGVLFGSMPYFWRNFGELLISGPLTRKYGKKKIENHLIMKNSVLLITARHPDGIKIDITVNNNKCVRNAQFYSLFGQLEVFSSTCRILKLFSRRNIGRAEQGTNILCYPGGFFYEMLVCQTIVEKNKGVNIESAFEDIDISEIRKALKKNGYSVKQCLKDCVDYLLTLDREKDLVFDYEECQYNYWSFFDKKVRETYQQKLSKLSDIIEADVYPVPTFFPMKLKGAYDVMRRKNRKKRF